MTHRNPLMPGSQRFPVMAPSQAACEGEPPGPDRPYVLRAWGPIPQWELRQCKHRTPATQRTIPRRTGRDNVFDDDSYTVPDD